MTSHQFARQLLCEPDLQILITGDNYEDLVPVTFTKTEMLNHSDENEEIILVHRIGDRV